MASFEPPSTANYTAYSKLHDHFDPVEVQNSDTHYASSPEYSPYPTATTTTTTTAAVSPTSPPFSNDPSLPNSRAARSQSVATQSSTVSGVQSIRRKPLSSAASPLATRHSTRDQLLILEDLPKPDQRFSRSCSVDSPTLYDFPHSHSGDEEHAPGSLKFLAGTAM